MKRFILLILALFFILTNNPVIAAQNYQKKELSVVTNDGFNIAATLTYPKIKNKKEYKTVILLHSHGTNSGWWENLPNKLLEKNYAVLTIDLRGHGKSVYNQKLLKVSWKNLTNNAYRKYPDDVLKVIKHIGEELHRTEFFKEYAIVGSDIGGSAGIIASDRMEIKPKTIVLLSPVVQTHGLYIPVSIAQLDNVDFLSISSSGDSASLEAEKYLKKFAQNEFSTYTSTSETSGMVLLKNDPEIIPIITEWISQYLKD